MAPRYYFEGNPKFATFRRYYQGSPNLGAFNLMIGTAVILCLWKLWVADEVTMPTTTMTTAQSQKYLSIYDGAYQQHILPIETLDGHPVVLLSSQLLSRSPKLKSPTKQNTIRPPTRKGSNVFPVEVKSTEKSPQQTIRNTVAMRAASAKTESGSKRNDKSRTISTSTLLQGGQHKSTTTSSASSAKQKYHHQHQYHGTRSQAKSFWDLVVLFAISGSIVTGAFYARTALEKLQRWEEQSNEDSLAYDMAYTDTVSEINYGSFVSSWDGGDLDKFDI